MASADNSVTKGVIVQPVADMRTTLTVPASADRGSTANLQGQIVNAGPNAASNARLSFTLPAGMTASASGLPSGCAISGSTVTCQAGTLAPNGTAAFQLQAAAATPGMQVISAVALSDAFDPDSPNNVAVANVVIKPVTDLAVTFSNPPSSVQASQAGTVTTTVTNNGPDVVTVAVATISGTGLSVTAAVPNGGSCAVSSGAANCSLGTLASGGSRTIEVSFTAGNAGSAQLNATTSSEATESASGNNSVASTVVVSAPPSSGGGGGGSGAGGSGGGALGLWGLLALLGSASGVSLRRRMVIE